MKLQPGDQLRPRPNLGLKDRLKALIRVIRIIFDPKVDYINLMWQTNSNGDPKDAPVYDFMERKAIYTHTFFVEGQIPVNTMLTYMAHVAGKSETLEDLNTRCEFYLGKVACAHMLMYPNNEYELRYIGNPIKAVKPEANIVII